METRAEYFKSEYQEKFKELIREEMTIRARAAEELAETFDIDGVVIQPGCNSDGSITILSGMDKILECYELNRETVVAEKKTIHGVTGEYVEYRFKIPELQTEFRYIDTTNPIKPFGEPEKVMPYDEI